MTSSPINVFQRLVMQWDQTHPYNAAQILKLEGVPNAGDLQDAWHDTLNDLGLGRVHIDGGTFRYECLNGEMSRYGVRMVPAEVSLEDHISQELNRPFDNPAEPPFRPFVVTCQGHYYAGVVYHHWIADSISIRMVLREWFVRLFDPKSAQRLPVRLASDGYRKFFGLEQVGASMGGGLLSATRWASSLRQVRRVDIHNGIDLRVRFAMRKLAPGWISTIHAAARARHVTLNDIFLAAIAQVCQKHVPTKYRPRRQSLALGSIVDLRPYSQGKLDDAFGLFLGFTNVICRPVELANAERLVQSIARQSHQQKLRGMPQSSAIRMLAGVALGRLVKPDGIPQFYQKHLPMAGGISNVNMNRSWATAYHPSPLLDYIRVSPTGPMMPLVFATTTLGKQFHIALTYRPSVVGDGQVDSMADTFHDFLTKLA